MTKLLTLPFFKSKPWFANENTIWMFTQIVLNRNLKTHFFPHKLEMQFMQKLSEMLSQILISSPLLKNAKKFEASELNPHEKELLYDYFLPQNDFSRFHGGELFLVDPDGESYITINMEDHLNFNRVEIHENLEECWNKLLKLESLLSKSLEFAFSPKFGFLTSDPHKCGTGLTIRTCLHLPTLVHLDLFKEKMQNIHKHFFELKSIDGSLESFLGDFILISNRQTLALSEETILKNMRRITLELFIAEKTKREMLTEKDRTLLKDKIGKAFGVLRHASQLSLKESLSYLSLCKLGVELGWIVGITLKELNTLFFILRKGYLTHLYPDLTHNDFEKKRSEMMSAKFQKMELKK